MGLIDSLFNRRPAFRGEPPDAIPALRGEPPDAIDDVNVNALFIPLRNRVSDFKDANSMSWALILPAIQRMSIRLFVQARGNESTLKFLECMISKMEEERGIGRHPDSAKAAEHICERPGLFLRYFEKRSYTVGLGKQDR
jgi:hypothetical protein